MNTRTDLEQTAYQMGIHHTGDTYPTQDDLTRRVADFHGCMNIPTGHDLVSAYKQGHNDTLRAFAAARG